MMSQTLHSITGVMGRRGFFGMIEVAFLIPLNSNSKRGRLHLGRGCWDHWYCGDVKSAARYILMVSHLSPFKARNALNSSNCCSEAGRGERATC